MHKSTCVWPLLFNMHPADKIDDRCYVSKPVKRLEPEPVASEPEQDNGSIPPREFLETKNFNAVMKIARGLGVNVENISNKSDALDLIDAKRLDLQPA